MTYKMLKFVRLFHYFSHPSFCLYFMFSSVYGLKISKKLFGISSLDSIDIYKNE